MATDVGAPIVVDDLLGDIETLQEQVATLIATQSRVIGGPTFAETDQTGITGLVDINDLSVTVTVPAGRIIRVTVQVFVSMTADSGLRIAVWEGATDWGGIADNSDPQAQDWLVEGSRIIRPTVGTHTYRARAERTIAVGSLNIVNEIPNGQPGFIMVEDIGADL